MGLWNDNQRLFIHQASYMLFSMTGYGRATRPYANKAITVELKSLNSKFTDVRVRTPQYFKEKETELRRLLLEGAERGKLELSVEVKSIEGDGEYGLNQPLFRRYHRELTSLADELKLPQGDILQAILRLPNVVATEAVEISDEEWSAVLLTFEEAMSKFDHFRLSEGAAMETDLRLRIANIMQLMGELAPYEEDRMLRMREKLNKSLDDHMPRERVDESRLEQEFLFYLEKMDITEEKVRLEQHCKYFLEELDTRSRSKGRKLSFISQEIGREINTLGSKAYSSDIQKIAVNMKDELEKIKEQVANSV